MKYILGKIYLYYKVKEFFSYRTDIEKKVPMQIVASGPESEEDEIKSGMLKMINSAKKYIYIQTPYFVPDSSVLTAIQLAAKSGVDVRLMIPGVPDKKYVYHNTLSYVGDVLGSGVKVYQYPGFLHAKTIVCDDDIVTIGTTNIDSRSFTLHFEINAFIYDDTTAIINKNIFLKDLALCREITVEGYEERKKKHPLSYMADGFFRLFSPIM